MDPIFRRAESLHVPLLLLTRPSRLPDLAARLEKFPELDVVIDHMADCNPKDEVGIGQLLDLARFPRAYVKISHTWGLSEEPYPWKDTHDLVQRVFQPLLRPSNAPVFRRLLRHACSRCPEHSAGSVQ